MIGSLEKERLEALWSLYLVERKRRFIMECWRRCERLHAKALLRLRRMEELVENQENGAAYDAATLATAQEADEADVAEEQRLILEAAAVRARLERCEEDLEAERQARLKTRRDNEAECNIVENELQLLRDRAVRLQQQHVQRNQNLISP